MPDDAAMQQQQVTEAMRCLADDLFCIEQADRDKDYAGRYQEVLRAMARAIDCGYAAGIRLDPDEPDWPVVYIELPTGQVSWHMPQHPIPFDGHDAAEKTKRIREYSRGK